MGYFSELDYELSNNVDHKGRTIPTRRMKEGETWFNPRDKKTYIMKNRKLIISID